MAGEVSKMTARAFGRSGHDRTGEPVTISPPSSVRCAASASEIACEPPAANGQPTSCAAIASSSAMPEVATEVSGTMACPASPASSARARGPRSSVPARAAVGSADRRPNLASRTGWAGQPVN